MASCDSLPTSRRTRQRPTSWPPIAPPRNAPPTRNAHSPRSTAMWSAERASPASTILTVHRAIRGGATSRHAVAWSAACPRTATPRRHASLPRIDASETAAMGARARSNSPTVIRRRRFAHALPPAVAPASARNAIPPPVNVLSASSMRTAAPRSRGASLQAAAYAEAMTIARVSAATSLRSSASTEGTSGIRRRRRGAR